MEATAALQNITHQDLDTLTDRDLFDFTVSIEKAMQCLHAQAMVSQAAAARRNAFRGHSYRSGSTALSHRTGLSRGSCARSIDQATILVDHLPKVHHYYEMALMNRSQIDLICRFYHDNVLREFVVRDQSFFLGIAHESWPVFRAKADAWARVTKDREEDDDPAGKAFKNRKLVWGQGLDLETLGEFHMPNEMFEQFRSILTPFYDALLRDEIKDARTAAGEDPSLAPAEGEFFDLTRSDSQRWLDALMSALRVRGGHLRALKLQAIAEGTDPDAELELDLDEVDAGVAAEVVILADQETLEREMARQAGVELEPRSLESMAKYVCQTSSGLPVAPSTALLYAQLGSFRRMIIKPDNLDFDMSRKARLFGRAKRLGVIARDKHCQGRGCDTAGKYCQIDHLEEYFRGGDTVPINAMLLCGPCNRFKEWLRANNIR